MKHLITLLLAFISLQLVHAQKGFNFGLAYPIAFPLSDMNDYISNTSFRGVSMEFNNFIKPNLNVGVETGWNIFYERVDNKVYTEETASISGVQYRYTNTFPIIAGAKYYKINNNSNIRPFIGVGAGTLYVDRDTDFGLYRINNDAWQFCIRPELGVGFRMAAGGAFVLSAKYFAGFEAEDLDGQSYISVNLGFIFRN